MAKALASVAFREMRPRDTLHSFLTNANRATEAWGRGARSAASIRASWREQGLLPFPEFSYEQRLQMENRLDYPPKGSPEHAPQGAPVMVAASDRLSPRTGQVVTRTELA